MWSCAVPCTGTRCNKDGIFYMSTPWKLPIVAELLEHPAVGIVQGHMCQCLMMSHIDRRGCEMGLVKKPTGFMRSSKFILEELDRRWPGRHDHVPLMAGRAAGAAIYPEKLCEAICPGVARQKKYDQGGTVSTGKMTYMGSRSSSGTSATCRGPAAM